MKNSSKKEISKLNEILNGEFKMKDFGEVKKITGIDIMINHKRSELFLSQPNYLKKIVDEFRKQNAKAIKTPLCHHTNFLVMQCSQTE